MHPGKYYPVAVAVGAFLIHSASIPSHSSCKTCYALKPIFLSFGSAGISRSFSYRLFLALAIRI